MGMIVKLKENAYVDWSSVCDAPSSSVMTKEEMVEFVKDQQLREMRLRPGELEKEEGRAGEIQRELFDLKVNQRLERIEKNGCSSAIGHTLQDFLDFNRAGKGETHLKTVEEIIETYTYTPEKKGQWPWT